MLDTKTAEPLGSRAAASVAGLTGVGWVGRGDPQSRFRTFCAGTQGVRGTARGMAQDCAGCCWGPSCHGSVSPLQLRLSEHKDTEAHRLPFCLDSWGSGQWGLHTYPPCVQPLICSQPPVFFFWAFPTTLVLLCSVCRMWWVLRYALPLPLCVHEMGCTLPSVGT